LTSLRVQRGFLRMEVAYAALIKMTGCSSTQERLESFGSKRPLLHITITYDMKDHFPTLKYPEQWLLL